MEGMQNDGLKIALSAAIGGTAEALGGGKFAVLILFSMQNRIKFIVFIPIVYVL
jgi:hypothetical protein